MVNTQTENILQELAVALREQIEGFQPTIEAVEKAQQIQAA